MTKKWSSIKKEKGAAPWEYGDIVIDTVGVILMYVGPDARGRGLLLWPLEFPHRYLGSFGLMWYGENYRFEALS